MSYSLNYKNRLPKKQQEIRLNEQYDKNGRDLMDLCKILSTSVAYRILICLLHGPKSVSHICLETQTPVSSTYKIIRELQGLGLISIQDIVIDDNGKRITIYESKVKSLTINLDKDGAHIKYNRIAV
jgi:hypothetical protein